ARQDDQGDPGPRGEPVVDVASVLVEGDDAEHRARAGHHGHDQRATGEVVTKLLFPSGPRIPYEKHGGRVGPDQDEQGPGDKREEAGPTPGRVSITRG